MNVHFIINSSSLSDFTNLYQELTDDVFDLRNPLSTNSNSILELSFDNYFVHNKIVLYSNCRIRSNKEFDKNDNGFQLVARIKEESNNLSAGCTEVFLQLTSVTNSQLSSLNSKYQNKVKHASGAFFYNFGETFILNKTFFDSGYSTFGENTAHEAINCFITDAKERYFYLCSNGKLPDNYNNPFSKPSKKRLPLNYIDWKKVVLINYSKFIKDEGNKSNYVILQKVKGIKPLDVAYDDKREESKYNGISYNQINICDLFRSNSYSRLDKKTNKQINDTEQYPYVSFILGSNGIVEVPEHQDNTVFNSEIDENISNSSSRQFVFKGTRLYGEMAELINNTKWNTEKGSTVEQYINTDAFKSSFEDCNLLSIIGMEDDEKTFTKILAYLFSKVPILFNEFVGRVFDNTILLNNITNTNITDVCSEKKYNVDVMVSFIDSNENKHLLIVENKLYAPFNQNEKKKLISFFDDKYKQIIDEVLDEYENEKKNSGPKEESQLTKYHLIARVRAKIESIEDENLHFVILAPEFRVDSLNDVKKNYYYGKGYKVVSYKLLKEAIDAVLPQNNQKDIKEILSQFSRSIIPYISDNYTYYQRTMINRFARSTFEKSHKD